MSITGEKVTELVFTKRQFHRFRLFFFLLVLVIVDVVQIRENKARTHRTLDLAKISFSPPRFTEELRGGAIHIHTL